MTSKLQGVAAAMDKMLHGIEDRADKFLNRVQGAEAKADTVFAKGHAKLDEREKQLGDIDGYLDAIDKASNG